MKKELCHVVMETARALNRTGLNQGRSGNVSVRSGDGLLITASGAHFDSITGDDVVFCDLQGGWEGTRKPSSELSFHAAIYRERPDAGAVVHVHSPWATSLACMHCHIPAYHYMIAVAGGVDIPCVPYATFGSEALAEHVTMGLRERDACLLANHGQIAVGSSADSALELAAEVENLARGYAQILAMGEPVLLDDREMGEVLVKFRSYHRNAQESES